jgi:large subunit ribosomal protein L15
VAEELNLSNLQPADKRRDKKRVGRGLGSGKGRYAGRGIKGQKARAGSHKMRAGFEGGQMPVYMRLGKQRGNTSKDAMPVGPFRTQTLPVNVAALERFDDGAEVTPEALLEARIIRKKGIDVKVLGKGELTKKLTVVAHRFSASARQKIESAGGKVVALREEEVKPKRGRSTGRTRQAAAEQEPPTDAPPSESGAQAEDSEG